MLRCTGHTYARGTAQTVLTVNTATSTPVPNPNVPFNLTIVATWNGGTAIVRTQTQPLPVTIVATDFTLGGPTFDNPTVKVGQDLTSTITLSSVDGGPKTLTLSCIGATSSGIAPSDCNFSPATLTAGTTPRMSALTVHTLNGVAGSGNVTVQASDGTTNKVAILPFSLSDYSVSVLAQPNNTTPGGTVTFSFLLTPSSAYNGSVSLSCTTASGLTCTFNPPSPSLIPGASNRVNATIAVPASFATGTYPLQIDTNDATVTSLRHPQAFSSFQVTSQPDFAMSFGSANSATVKAGSTATGTFAVTASGPFNSSVAFTIGGCPSNATCSVAPNPATPTAATPVNATLTVVTRAASTASLQRGFRTYLAMWLGISFGAMGMVLVRRPRGTAALLLIACALIVGMTACGGGGGGGGSSNPVPVPGTPAGTYTIVVTGTSGTTVKTSNFTLTVQ